jgi:hypothetical protein
MLSYSLPYGHVLYCMNNETSSEAGWGQFWIRWIQKRAAEKGVTVWATDMFDDAYLGPRHKHAPIVFDDPEHYMFADISQVNSRNFDQTHWDRLRWLLQQVHTHPRPSNHTKIYGSGYHSFGTGGPEDGIERFWRNILGGSAAARFHRPNAGNGLNDLAKASIMAARLLESQIKFWDITPHMELLSDREPTRRTWPPSRVNATRCISPTAGPSGWICPAPRAPSASRGSASRWASPWRHRNVADTV